MKITIEFKDVNEYLEYKNKTTQNEQPIHINTSTEGFDLKSLTYLLEQIQLYPHNGL